MLSGVLITIGVELCVLIAYIVFRAKRELKEEETPLMYDEHLGI
jgi:hypothetical protein